MRIMVLGSSGMIGSACLSYLSKQNKFEVVGLERPKTDPDLVSSNKKLMTEYIESFFDSALESKVKSFSPDIVINAVGVVKQRSADASDYEFIKMNALLPHHLSKLMIRNSCKMINITTDCVYDGVRGNYCEEDITNANDIYGRTKALGEVAHEQVLNLRASLIGHERANKLGFLEWFLSTSGNVAGYSNAIFSGLTTLEFCKILVGYVLPKKTLHGTFHVSGEKISKYELLQIIASVYDHKCEIYADASFHINRSLNGSKFNKISGYNPKSWIDQIKELKRYEDSETF